MCSSYGISTVCISVHCTVNQLNAASVNKYESELSEVRSDLERTRQELVDLTRRENALVKQQSTLSVEKVAEERARKLAESEVRTYVRM